MITVGMNYEVLPGKEKIFEGAFQGVLEIMKKMTGHVSSQLYQDVRKKGSYLIISEWQSQDAFQSFIGSEQFAKVTSWGREQVLSSRPKHRVYTA